MVSEGMMEGGTVKVDVKDDKFVFDVKKKAVRKRAGARKRKKAVGV